MHERGGRANTVFCRQSQSWDHLGQMPAQLLLGGFVKQAQELSLEGFQQTGSAERHFLRGIGCAHSDERIRIRQSFYQLREECGTLKDQPRDLIGLADGTAIAAAQLVQKRT